MKLRNFLFISVIIALGASCSSGKKKETGAAKENMVLIETTLGNIKVKLYNETPKHRDNFLKLVSQKMYDSLLFHRVIEKFMIQGGDPDSKRAKVGIMLGDGDVGYTIPAEFNQKVFHKKGALAAARNGDDVNPKKESSGCQFYIVQGKNFNDSLLNLQLDRVNGFIKQGAFVEYMTKPENKTLKDNFEKWKKEMKWDSLKVFSEKMNPIIEAEVVKKGGFYKFTDEQRKVYTSTGGAPHLDGNYTVFGEVLEGMETVDKIAAVKRDKNDRPETDVRIIKMTVVKK